MLSSFVFISFREPLKFLSLSGLRYFFVQIIGIKWNKITSEGETPRYDESFQYYCITLCWILINREDNKEF